MDIVSTDGICDFGRGQVLEVTLDSADMVQITIPDGSKITVYGNGETVRQPG